MSAEELKFVVEALARPPFSQSISLVEFSEKRGVELLQLVNDVFAVIDPVQKCVCLCCVGGMSELCDCGMSGVVCMCVFMCMCVCDCCGSLSVALGFSFPFSTN